MDVTERVWTDWNAIKSSQWTKQYDQILGRYSWKQRRTLVPFTVTDQCRHASHHEPTAHLSPPCSSKWQSMSMRAFRNLQWSKCFFNKLKCTSNACLSKIVMWQKKEKNVVLLQLPCVFFHVNLCGVYTNKCLHRPTLSRGKRPYLLDHSSNVWLSLWWSISWVIPMSNALLGQILLTASRVCIRS
jgi:hypothetical protein